MASIDLRNAAKHHRELSHQIAAWNWLQEQLTDEQLAEFALLYRADPPPPPPPPGSFAVELALPLIKHFEGFSAKAYPDPLSGGEPITIGYGTTRYPDGRRVQMGDVVTEEQAERYLRWYAAAAEETQRNRIPTWKQMNVHQQAAILSFSFNFGQHWYNSHGFATLTRNLRESDWDAVPDTLLMYRNPGTAVEEGLRRRRVAEGQLFRSGIWRA